MYAQLLIAVSFAVATYQDFTERSVNDLIWLPAGAATAYIVYWFLADSTTAAFELFLVKVALIGAMALVFTLMGAVGQADAIALAFVAVDPYSASPLFPLVAAAAIALTHIGYEYAVGNAGGKKVIAMDQFLKEQRWIPEAVVSDGTRTEVSSDVNVARDEVEAANNPGAQVEVKYGVPTVAYLGLGYVAYLAYLLLFNYTAFTSLP